MKRIPTLRGMRSQERGVSGADRPDARCEVCGSKSSRVAGIPCSSCAEFVGKNASNSVHSCGGCGVAFVVRTIVTLEPVEMDGVARVYCACCHDFLAGRIPSMNMATTPGYDVEGQIINAGFPDLTPTVKRRHRERRIQELLGNILVDKALRSGVEPPAPLFLAT
jgi:hypothetical protein